ncbi:MAG: AmmeMemoRadiSam system protein B [Bacteroidales bacterium]|jgi:AmmeMemoRadiSam system protein B|nr:AmmeMemoRadiSam system protein B [Bacteroidales bacterium]
MHTIRKTSAAGRFYPQEEKSLQKMLDELLQAEKASIIPFRAKDILGGVVPHAGYVYSGRNAMHFYHSLSLSGFSFDTAIILSPNHSGWGPGLALDDHQAWVTPLGIVELDWDFYPLLQVQQFSDAHQHEHSAEVQLPMLQYFFKHNFRILPISMWDQSPQTAQSLALQLVSANKKLNKKILVVASSDFSHYVTPLEGRSLDDLALDRMTNLDINGMARVIHQNNISICGYGPIMTLMAMGKLLFDAPGVKILHRSHSGQVVPSDEVVHYVSAVLSNKAY